MLIIKMFKMQMSFYIKIIYFLVFYIKIIFYKIIYYVPSQIKPTPKIKFDHQLHDQLADVSVPSSSCRRQVHRVQLANLKFKAD